MTRESSEVILQPVTPGDYPFLYSLLVGGDVGARWRFRGATPSPDGFERTLWSGVLCQYIARVSPPGEPAGLAVVFHALMEAGHAEIGLAFEEKWHRSGVMARAALGLIGHTFRSWPMRKLYARIPAFNIPQIQALTKHGWVEEAQLVDYAFADGRYWDEMIYSLSRESWEQLDSTYGRFAAVLGA